MICLAFDLATNTGWAAGDFSGSPDFGSERLGEAGAGHGARFTQAFLLANRLINEYRPDVVAIEEAIPAGPKGAASRSQMAMGYRAAVLMACYKNRLDPVEYHISSIRKHFIGTGKGGNQAKHQTMENCLSLGWGIEDDNQADALAVWSFAGHKNGELKTMPVGGLF